MERLNEKLIGGYEVMHDDKTTKVKKHMSGYSSVRVILKDT